MEMPLEEIQKIHLSCDEAGRVSLTVIHKKGGEGKILRPGDVVVFEKAARWGTLAKKGIRHGQNFAGFLDN